MEHSEPEVHNEPQVPDKLQGPVGEPLIPKDPFLEETVVAEPQWLPILSPKPMKCMVPAHLVPHILPVHRPVQFPDAIPVPF